MPRDSTPATDWLKVHVQQAPVAGLTDVFSASPERFVRYVPRHATVTHPATRSRDRVLLITMAGHTTEQITQLVTSPDNSANDLTYIMIGIIRRHFLFGG